jgi:hypothetical protein
MNNHKSTRDEEISRMYKRANFTTPKAKPKKTLHDPQQLSLLDKECYWKSLLRDPYALHETE